MISLSVAAFALTASGAARPLGPALHGASRARQCRMSSVSGIAYSASEVRRSCSCLPGRARKPRAWSSLLPTNDARCNPGGPASGASVHQGGVHALRQGEGRVAVRGRDGAAFTRGGEAHSAHCTRPSTHRRPCF